MSQDKTPELEGEALPGTPVAPHSESQSAAPSGVGSGDQESGSGAEQPEMTLSDHLVELRTRLIRCAVAVLLGFFVCYYFSEDLFNWLATPLYEALPVGSHLIYTDVTEAFFTFMKVSFIASIFFVSPYIFYQLWAFISPGLYSEEKKIIIPIAIVSGFCFVGGAAFGYQYVFPVGFKFLVGYVGPNIMPMPSLKEYLDFAFKLLFAFGLIFELPVFILFLARIGIVTPQWLAKQRRYWIILAFIIGAVLTPGPDIFSQLMMAAPLIILYEVGIIVARLFGKKKEPAPEESKNSEEKV